MRYLQVAHAACAKCLQRPHLPVSPKDGNLASFRPHLPVSPKEGTAMEIERCAFGYLHFACVFPEKALKRAAHFGWFASFQTVTLLVSKLITKRLPFASHTITCFRGLRQKGSRANKEIMEERQSSSVYESKLRLAMRRGGPLPFIPGHGKGRKGQSTRPRASRG